MDNFVFGDVNTQDFNIYIFDLNTDMSPNSLVDEIEIPGRNGSLLMQNSYFQNVTHRYMGVVYEDAAENLRWFRNEMMKYSGYQRLEDSIHEEEFYEARYVGGLEPTLTPERTMAKFAIEFSRRPQRFLKSGEKEIEFTGSRKFQNPSAMNAKPLIKVYGNGTLSINGKTITVSSHSRPYVCIDAEMMDCYYGAINLNSYVEFQGDTFPEIPAGESTISTSGSISKVIVTPRWWTV